MGSRLGFLLSILVACAFHAVVLLVPRAATAEEAQIPTVELDLSAAAITETTPTVARQIAHRVALSTLPIMPQEAPAPFVPPEPLAWASSLEQPSSSLPASLEPAEAPGSNEAQVGSASGDSSKSTASAASPSGGVAGTTSNAAAVPVAAISVLVPPWPRAEILPAYPRSARRSGLEGVVKVTAMVDASGNVASAEVLASSGHASLDQAALEAVRRALFAPALQEGKPVPCRIVIPIRFQLSVR